MPGLFKTVPGVDELFDAQLRNPEEAYQRTWCNVMDMYPWLPQDAKNVIDLGCGSGRVSIGLSKLWNSDARYWLVDGSDTGNPAEKWGVFEDAGEGFYNQNAITSAFCDANHLNFDMVTIDEELNWSQLPAKADVLFSMYSIGNHYPLALYEELYPRILKPGAVVFFTYRPKTGPIPSFFEVVEQREDTYKTLAGIRTPGLFTVARFSHDESTDSSDDSVSDDVASDG